MKYLTSLIVSLFLSYSIIGSGENVGEIKQRVRAEMESRNWEIMRYEGYQLGSFGNHGGKVYYHVRNIDNHDIQYRVYVTLWDGELHYTYGTPESLSRHNISISGD